MVNEVICIFTCFIQLSMESDIAFRSIFTVADCHIRSLVRTYFTNILFYYPLSSWHVFIFLIIILLVIHQLAPQVHNQVHTIFTIVCLMSCINFNLDEIQTIFKCCTLHRCIVVFESQLDTHFCNIISQDRTTVFSFCKVFFSHSRIFRLAYCQNRLVINTASLVHDL